MRTEKVTPDQSDVTPTTTGQKEFDILNLTTTDLELASRIKLRKLLVEVDHYWRFYKQGKLNNINVVITSYILLAEELNKRKMVFSVDNHFKRFVRRYSRTHDIGKKLLFAHQDIHQQFTKTHDDTLFDKHTELVEELDELNYAHPSYNDELDQLWQWQKKFDIQHAEADMPVEEFRFNYWLTEQFLECKAKSIYTTALTIPYPKMGSYLKSLSSVFKEYDLKDTRNFRARGWEAPPVYETIELALGKKEDFLIQGYRFYERGPYKIVSSLNPTWSGLEFQFAAHIKDREVVKATIESMHKWVKENNLLKNQKFSLTGKFLHPTEVTWNDLKLSDELQGTLNKLTKLVNDTELKKTSRGLLFIGPPGTGKTLTGKILMNKTKSTFIWVSPRDLERCSLSLAFELARELAPTVLFIEDIDTYLSSRIIDLFKTELDGLVANEGVCTILTTNFPQLLPKALLDRPGRFHDICNFDLPDENIRLKMIKHFISEISDDMLNEVVQQTEGFSGAHLKELVDFAKLIQKDEACDIDRALTLSLEKLHKQRNLIQQIEACRNK